MIRPWEGAFLKLQLGISVTVDEGVDLASFLAEGAVVAAVVFVLGDVFDVKDAIDRDILDVIHIAEQSAEAGCLAAVVPNAVQSAVYRFAGGDGGDQQKNVFAPDLFLNVIPENHLVKGVDLRGDHGDVLARVDKSKSRF